MFENDLFTDATVCKSTLKLLFIFSVFAGFATERYSADYGCIATRQKIESNGRTPQDIRCPGWLSFKETPPYFI